MNRSSVTLVALAASLLLLTPPDARADGQTELTPNSIMTVAERVEFIQERYGQTEGRLVYRTPEMQRVQIVNFTYDSEGDLAADLCYPPGTMVVTSDGSLGPPDTGVLNSSTRLPVLIFAMGNQLRYAHASGLDTWRDQLEWVDTLALFPPQGVVAVAYDAADVDTGFERLLEFLDRHQSELGLDMSRLGLFAMSGHGRVAGVMVGHHSLSDNLRCVVTFHSNIQVMTVPDRPLRFYVVHSGGYGDFDQYGHALSRRMSELGHEVVEVSNAAAKNFQFEIDTPRSREIVQGAAEFVRRALVE